MLPKTTVTLAFINGIKKTWQSLCETIFGLIPKMCDLVSRGYSLYLQLVKKN